MPAADASDDKESRFVLGPGGRFDQRFIPPKRLRLDKVDHVFDPVGDALLWVELKLHDAI